MSRLIGLGLLLAGLLYPFAVYFGMAHFAPWQFALLLGGLWLARALTGQRRPGSLWMAVVALAFCALLALFNSPALLRWYPVLISGFMLSLFGLSLKFGPPMIERLARLSAIEFADEAPGQSAQIIVRGEVAALPLAGMPLPV